MSKPEASRNIGTELRAIFVGMAAGALLVAAIVLSYGRFDWQWLVSILAASLFMALPIFAMYRWGIPLVRRLRDRLEASAREARTMESEAQVVGTRTIWLMRVRFHMGMSLFVGVSVSVFVGLTLGNLFVFLALGFLFGIGLVVTWAAVWKFSSDELRTRGFRW